jgi:hypothetical protein
MTHASIEQRLAAVEAELSALVEECRDGRAMVPQSGRICMAHYFSRAALDDMRRRFVPRGGIERSLPAGDRR